MPRVGPTSGVNTGRRTPFTISTLDILASLGRLPGSPRFRGKAAAAVFGSQAGCSPSRNRVRSGHAEDGRTPARAALPLSPATILALPLERFPPSDDFSLELTGPW